MTFLGIVASVLGDCLFNLLTCPFHSVTSNRAMAGDGHSSPLDSVWRDDREPGFLVAGEGAVWVQEQGDGTLARIDPETGEPSGRVKIDETLKYGDIDAGGGKVWLRTTAGQTFVVIDPKTLVVRARVGRESGSGALRYTPRGVWTTSHDVHTLSWWKEPARIGS